MNCVIFECTRPTAETLPKLLRQASISVVEIPFHVLGVAKFTATDGKREVKIAIVPVDADLIEDGPPFVRVILISKIGFWATLTFTHNQKLVKKIAQLLRESPGFREF